MKTNTVAVIRRLLTACLLLIGMALPQWTMANGFTSASQCQEDTDSDGVGYGYLIGRPTPQAGLVCGAGTTKITGTCLETFGTCQGGTMNSESDNCPTVSNADQLNSDGDAQGNACDQFPLDASEFLDIDNDGIGNNADTDDDNDGVLDINDAYPLDPTRSVLDSDSDGIGNTVDNCPSISNADQLNTDGDTQGNVCDVDDDNDGVVDVGDAFPLDNSESVDTDGDGIGNNADPTPNGDTDNDGLDNNIDNCISVSNTDQLNTDGDAQGNACDSDDDNDGVPDVSDAFPLDVSEFADSDGDGIGDNSDNCPVIVNIDQLNTDGDVQGDACDVFVDDPLLLLQKDGAAKSEQLGSSVALADMNNDGVVDLLIGSPMTNASSDGKILKRAGKIQIISGKNNAVIRTINGTAANQQLGTAIAVVPDQNKDGVLDIVVGDPLADVAKLTPNGFLTLKDAGRVLLYSGSDGRMLHILAEGNAAGDHFGVAVAAGDTNGDSKEDLIVGAPMSDAAAKDAGQISVFNGISKKLLYTSDGTQTGEHFGAAVAVANGHLFVGSPQFDNVTLKDAGRVSIFNSSDGSIASLPTVDGSAKGDSFGAAITAVNDDWAVGTPLADGAGKDAGMVEIFSGLNTIRIATLTGSNTGDHFGSALNMQGDVNKDGTSDIAISAVKFDANATKDAGRVQVLSGVAL
ncbi:MAG TPA: thrombospondin type 3 repeat-containing protein [Pseudomonadales bacterium]|nr:thrombospondin type 3 repeat-containing protein [Pseudomonadales bacterium]